MLVACGWVQADDSAPPDSDLTALTLVQLTQMPVTTAARKPEVMFDTDAAVFVITREDIRRSGATTLPDVLRMAPGVEVAQAHDNDWYVTIRGFNNETENKLLVLVDGRTIYSPMFSGVFWYEQDFVLEDIERIEIIRGPGASQWGANAVNGVINIITSHGRDLQGGRVSVTGGTFDRAIVSGRYGFQVGQHGYVAAWVQTFRREQSDDERNADRSLAYNWEGCLLGFRYDWDPPTPSAFSLQGGWHIIEADDDYPLHSLLPPYRTPVEYERNGTIYHLQGSYSHRFSETSVASVQFFTDSGWNEYGNGTLKHKTYDVDAQHQFALGERQEIVWGAGYRLVTDTLETPADIGVTFLDPVEDEYHVISCFIEDEIEVVEDRLQVRLGSKIEHNEFTGVEIQPTARFLSTLADHQVVWGAVSRAVRTPSRLDADSYGGFVVAPEDLGPGVMVPMEVTVLEGDPESEELLSFELGYRVQPNSRFWLDVACFHNEYDDLRTYAELTPGPIPDPGGYPRLVYEIMANSEKQGHARGAEISASWNVCRAWTLKAAYSHIELDLEREDGSIDIDGVTAVERNSPRHRLSLRSQWDITTDLEFDVWVRYQDEIPGMNVDAYTTFDARLAWRPCRDVEVALVGRNLSEEWHREWNIYEVERSVHGTLTWAF
jgi:iron complex outermembrane receptor protein